MTTVGEIVMASYENIIVEKKEGIGIIKINRPNMLNALNKDTITELTKAVGELEKDKNIKVAILTGEGKAFIAGADIKQMKEMNSWRGYRHAYGLKVRGQRTKATGRKGKAVGVKVKKRRGMEQQFGRS